MPVCRKCGHAQSLPESAARCRECGRRRCSWSAAAVFMLLVPLILMTLGLEAALCRLWQALRRPAPGGRLDKTSAPVHHAVDDAVLPHEPPTVDHP